MGCVRPFCLGFRWDLHILVDSLPLVERLEFLCEAIQDSAVWRCVSPLLSFHHCLHWFARLSLFPNMQSERMRGYEHGHAYIQAANRPILLDDLRVLYAREEFASICMFRFAVNAAKETTERSLLAHNRSVRFLQPLLGSLLYQYWLR